MMGHKNKMHQVKGQDKKKDLCCGAPLMPPPFSLPLPPLLTAVSVVVDLPCLLLPSPCPPLPLLPCLLLPSLSFLPLYLQSLLWWASHASSSSSPSSP